MVTPEELLLKGFSLVPVPRGRKHPVDKAWNERAKVITDPAEAFKLCGRNIGLAHAYCTPTPTCAIDIDDYPESRAWFGARGLDLREMLSAEDAVLSTSQRRYRIKAFYRLPRATGPVRGFKVKSAQGANILEFRCATEGGKTEQDVLPPSIHPDTGKPYIWVGGSDPTRMPVIPPSVLTLWQAELVNRSASNASLMAWAFLGYPSHPETPAEVARLLDKLSYISADCSYEQYRNVVWAILGTGWSCAEDLARDWCESAPDRFEGDDFLNVVKSFDPSRDSRPTMGTVFHLARQGGWRG